MTTEIKTATASHEGTTEGTTKLPEYYDTGEHDTTREKTNRRCKDGGRVDQDVPGSSVVHNRVLVEDAPSSVATTDPTQCATAAVVHCVVHYYYYRFRQCDDLLAPPLPRQYV